MGKLLQLLLLIIVLAGLLLLGLFSDELVTRIQQYGKLNAIEKAFREGDAKSALKQLKKAVADYPEEPVFHFKLGVLHHHLKQYKKARTQYERGFQLNPHAHQYRLNYARLLVHHREPNKAIQQYRILLNENPGHIAALDGLGDLYRFAGNRADSLGFNQERYALWNWARYYYSLVLKLNRDDVKAWYGLGEVLQRGGQYAAASASFCQVLRLQPLYAAGWFNLGLSEWYQDAHERGMVLMNWSHQLRDSTESEAFRNETQTIFGLRQHYYLKKREKLSLHYLDKAEVEVIAERPEGERTLAHYPQEVQEACAGWSQPQLNTKRPTQGLHQVLEKTARKPE